jgi:hypothetical protein
MYYFLFLPLVSVMNNFKDLNPAYLDLAKILVGTVGWIGSLTLYMWIREQRKMVGVRA